MRKLLLGCIVLLFMGVGERIASAQVFPPGTFSIDGVPINCGPVVFIVTPNFNDSGFNDGQGHIYLNPIILRYMPHVMKMFAAAHECGHSVVGPNETAADCWAIQTGRNQGWFPPQAFQDLIFAFQNNPGDLSHPPGPARVQNMLACYRGR